MGRRSRRGPIAFMPSDGKFLGAKDLQGLPVGPDRERMPILITDVVGYDKGERVNGRAMPEFWALEFMRQPNGWLKHPWPKPELADWIPSRKEWKLGPVVIGRIALRLGAVLDGWVGKVLPIRMEETTFGRDTVHCVRPVPLPWERDPQRKAQALKAIAAGTWVPDNDEPPQDEVEHGCPACGQTQGHQDGCPEAPESDDE